MIWDWGDLAVRTLVFVVVFIVVFLVIPKVMIPDIIQEFKKVFGQKKPMRIEMTAYKGKRKLWDTRSTFNKIA